MTFIIPVIDSPRILFNENASPDLRTATPDLHWYRLAGDNEQGNPINNRAFIDAEYNRAFVFTQYAGYLRRNSDIGGFLFWLGQVNGAPLRDVARQHAMVCSFVTSAGVSESLQFSGYTQQRRMQLTR